jgi:hypothetical protein
MTSNTCLFSSGKSILVCHTTKSILAEQSLLLANPFHVYLSSASRDGECMIRKDAHAHDSSSLKNGVKANIHRWTPIFEIREISEIVALNLACYG